MIVPIAEKNHYKIVSQVSMTPGLGGGKHRLDALITASNGEEIAVSVKWQGGGGSVDEKIPYEIVKMLTLMDQHPGITRAYIVLAGKGYRKKLLEYYRGSEMLKYIPAASRVKIVDTDEFIHLCNRKAL